MKVGGLRARDHIRLLYPLFVLIAAVFLLRLILAAADSPEWVVRLVSVTTTTGISILIAVALLHFRHSGGYANAVFASFLINIWAQLLIIGAISVSALFGTTNVYTYPEYSPAGLDPYRLRHILGHISAGMGFGTLEGAAAGCIFLWLLRMVLPVRREESNQQWPP